MTSTISAILYIPYVPESIFWRPYLCKAVSGTLLESFIEGFRTKNPDIDLRVLVHSEDVNTEQHPGACRCNPSSDTVQDPLPGLFGSFQR
jgi:hypothetical protein